MGRRRGERGALPKLDALLHKSASSLTVPFTTTHDAPLFSSAARVPAACPPGHP